MEATYYKPTSAWYTFSRFCADLSEELGETLFCKLQPVEERNLFKITIPEGNRTRVRESIKARCWVDSIYNYGKTKQ